MPVTIRAAASKAEANKSSINQQEETTFTNKKVHQCRAKAKQKQTEFQAIISQQTEPTSLSVEPASSSQLLLPTITSLSLVQSIMPFEEPNDTMNETLNLDVNEFTNVPVIKGEITTGTSIRGGKMIFMNGFSYLYMGEGKETIGWRCARRDENCKAVIHVEKETGQFSRWNGAFHCHAPTVSKTRKREILNKIKKRVLDEYIPIKIIVKDEYRKANLTPQEKQVMPLPSQIGIEIVFLLLVKNYVRIFIL